MTFEDLNDFVGSEGYYVPNENARQWREFIKRTPIYRAAGICSSGEVGFFGILPLVRKELVLVDHNYSSLSIAMTKYLVMRDWGWREAYHLFTGENVEALKKALDFVRPQLPPKVQEHCHVTNGAAKIVKEWQKYDAKLVQKAASKLHMVKFLHGDLTDLIPFGPFNLLYLSNALEHSSRNGRVVAKELEKALRPGGYVIACGGGIPHDWKELKSEYTKQEGGYISWTQRLVKVPESVTA